MNLPVSDFTMQPIGYVHCTQRYRYEAPKQGKFARNSGIIRLERNMNFEQAVADLEGFDRIWVVFAFHLNCNWRSTVTPPATGEKKSIGLFATRSPHRPNRIGISCVELEAVDGVEIKIRNFDMLDLTPVLDIKPYVPEYDSFPESHTGWLPQPEEHYNITFSSDSEKRAEFIFAASGLDLKNFCHVQLSTEPLKSDRKRIAAVDDLLGKYTISCRTWRVLFAVDHDKKSVTIESIGSGYLPDELALSATDRYKDKELHREFVSKFAHT